MIKQDSTHTVIQQTLIKVGYAYYEGKQCPQASLLLAEAFPSLPFARQNPVNLALELIRVNSEPQTPSSSAVEK